MAIHLSLPYSIAITDGNGLNQTIFVGVFFFLSGIFFNISLARKGTTSFLKDKYLRVALLAFVYTLLASPVQTATLTL